MTKPEALEKIIKAGYHASLESNVIMAELPDAGALKEFRSKLKEIGYGASYGYRIQAGSTAPGKKDAGNLKSGREKPGALEKKEQMADMSELYHIGDDGQITFF